MQGPSSTSLRSVSPRPGAFGPQPAPANGQDGWFNAVVNSEPALGYTVEGEAAEEIRPPLLLTSDIGCRYKTEVVMDQQNRRWDGYSSLNQVKNGVYVNDTTKVQNMSLLTFTVKKPGKNIEHMNTTNKIVFEGKIEDNRFSGILKHSDGVKSVTQTIENVSKEYVATYVGEIYRPVLELQPSEALSALFHEYKQDRLHIESDWNKDWISIYSGEQEETERIGTEALIKACTQFENAESVARDNVNMEEEAQFELIESRFMPKVLENKKEMQKKALAAAFEDSPLFRTQGTETPAVQSTEQSDDETDTVVQNEFIQGNFGYEKLPQQEQQKKPRRRDLFSQGVKNAVNNAVNNMNAKFRRNAPTSSSSSVLPNSDPNKSTLRLPLQDEENAL